MSRARVLLLLVLLAPAGGLADDNHVIVATDKGAVRGLQNGQVSIYKGVPFAAPPIGPLRWRPPQATAAWAGVHDALAFGPICPQPQLRPFPEGITVSENCLSLNIWTPATPDGKAKLPVMVWIHGGGFRIGSGAIHKVFTPGPMPLNDFTSFVDKGVVIVTLNYRMGLLGVFAHPALSRQQADEPLANYGLLDQIAALEWTRNNIAAFGGDPENITLFGQSAGGASVNALMVSPLSAGLFHRAISQSSPGMLTDMPYLHRNNGDIPSLESAGLAFADALGIANDGAAVPALRELPLAQLVNAAAMAVSATPVVDGQILPASPGQMFQQGAQHKIPYMAGANSLDGSVFMRDLSAYDEILGEIPDDVLSQTYGELPEQALKVRFAGDRVFVVPSWSLVRQMSNIGAPGYFYLFSYVPTAMAATQAGAAHGAEMPFVFRNLDWREYPHRPTSAEKSLSELMSSYWTNFARSGNPNGDGLPQWPANTRSRDALMEFRESPSVVDGALTAQVRLHLPLLKSPTQPADD